MTTILFTEATNNIFLVDGIRLLSCDSQYYPIIILFWPTSTKPVGTETLNI